MRLPNGALRAVEVHWYEAHGIGKRDLKIKRYLDESSDHPPNPSLFALTIPTTRPRSFLTKSIGLFPIRKPPKMTWCGLWTRAARITSITKTFSCLSTFPPA